MTSTSDRQIVPAWELIDRLCDEFERGWLAGQPVPLEDVVRGAPEAVQGELFRELLAVERAYCERNGRTVADAKARFSGLGVWADGIIQELLAPEFPASVGGFRVVRPIGAGGMGIVYLADDTLGRRQVAVKVMQARFAADPFARDRFLREARSAMSIENDHVVPVYQVGLDGTAPFLVMPVLRGESLEDRLAREPLLPLSLVLKVGREVALGLAAAHDKGLVHRDVKPSNTWLEGDPAAANMAAQVQRVKILDFGLARAADGTDGPSVLKSVVGTPAYMAPEQARGESVDARADLFSLGGILYRMVTGQPAFRGSGVEEVLAAVAKETPLSPMIVNSTIPRALSNLVMQLLAKDPNHRPQSATAVEAALASINDRRQLNPSVSQHAIWKFWTWGRRDRNSLIEEDRRDASPPLSRSDQEIVDESVEFLLLPQQGWLSQQPEFAHSWVAGLRWVEVTLDDCLNTYTAALGIKSLEATHNHQLRLSLGHALLHHWRCAWECSQQTLSAEPISGDWLIDTIRRGMRPTTPHAVKVAAQPMGGDPLRDLVLAGTAVAEVEALLRPATSDSPNGIDRTSWPSGFAVRRLYEEYQEVFEQEAQRVTGRGPRPAEWEDLFTRLVLPRQIATAVLPLAEYRGYSSLRTWLRPVIRNFLIDAWRSLVPESDLTGQKRNERSDRLVSQSSEEVDVELYQSAEKQDALRILIRRAWAQLNVQEQHILHWAIYSGLPDITIAGKIGVDVGHASQLREKALMEFHTALRKAASLLLVPTQLRAELDDFSPVVSEDLIRVLGETLKLEEASQEADSAMLTTETARRAFQITTRLPPSPIVGSRQVLSLVPLSSWMEDRANVESGISLLPQGAFRSAEVKETPESLARELLCASATSRPVVVCLDARLTKDATDVESWLERFDAILHEVPSDAEDLADVYEPRRVVLLSQTAKPNEYWIRRSDITWLRPDAQDMAADPYAVYTAFAQQAFARILTSLPNNPRPVPPHSGSLEDLLSESQLHEWRERMKQLDAWASGDPEFTS